MEEESKSLTFTVWSSGSSVPQVWLVKFEKTLSINIQKSSPFDYISSGVLDWIM